MSSEEDFSDEEHSLEHLRSQILGCLDGIHSAGSFATFAHNIEHIHPGLTVKGVGLIRLPLCREDANALIRVSRQARFGKGRKTVVDQTVGKTWEIDGKELSFENEGWNSWLDRVLENVSIGLGIHGGAGSVQAELYKLLVYEEGAFFKPHKDTEKTRNMFGTLVVCLPSKHAGGGVRMIHGKEEKVLETDQCSTYGVSYLAWYSDVSHEVLPVQSGYRVVLTYNLINTTVERRLSAAVLDNEQSKIDRMLTEWYSMQDWPWSMCYVLQHKYTGARLQLSGLKGDDYYRCSQLAKACQSNGRFCVFLSRLELTVTRINDKWHLEDGGEELSLQDIVTLQGLKLQDSLVIRKDCLVQRNLYEAREHEKQWGGEHLGADRYAYITQVYHDAVAVIVSRGQMTEFLLGSGQRLTEYSEFLLDNGQRLTEYSEFLEQLFTNLKDKNSDERCLFREMIVQTCQRHIEGRYNQSRTKDDFMGPTAIASLRIENLEVANAALGGVEDSFNTSTFQNLGMLGFEKTRKFSTKTFSRISKLHLVDRGLRAFLSGISDTTQPDPSKRLEGEVYQWALHILRKALNSITKVLPQDAGAVVQIMSTYEDESLWKSMDTFVGRFTDDATFANALLVETLCYSETVQKPDLVKHLLSLILDTAISSFQLHQFSSFSKQECPREDYPFSSWPDISLDDNERGKKDAAVIVSLYRLVRDDLVKAGQLLENIANGTAIIHHDDLDRLIIPLLRGMIDITKHQPFKASLFYSKVISTYIERVVQKEPPKPQDWSLPDDIQSCDESNCTYCSLVREFLGDPNKEVHLFTIPNEQYYAFVRHLPYHYKKTTEGSGQNHKVKVTKTLETWERNHQEWRSRVDPAQSALRSLPETPLRQCLGNGEYQNLMELRIVKLSTEYMTEEPQNSAQAEEATVTPGRSAGPAMRKRKRQRF